VNKVTEEAVRRVQDDQKKAQQVGQDIKKDKATNNKFAKFLTFLLKDIKSDTLLKQIYHTFFKTRHEETDLIHLRKNMNTIVVVGMFVPFYQEMIKELELE
jgi:glucuronate isomerase